MKRIAGRTWIPVLIFGGLIGVACDSGANVPTSAPSAPRSGDHAAGDVDSESGEGLVFSGEAPDATAAYFRETWPDGRLPGWFDDAVYDLSIEHMVDVLNNSATDAEFKATAIADIRGRMESREGMEDAWEARVRFENGTYHFTAQAPDTEEVRTTMHFMRLRWDREWKKGRERLKETMRRMNLPVPSP